MNKITEKNLGNYSTFTTDKGYKLDEFVEFTDIQADEYPLVEELQTLLSTQNKTPEQLARMNELSEKFKDKIPTSYDWNKFCACLISMEKFILVEINGYIALMKKDLKEYTDARKAEIESLIGQMDYKEIWNKDVLYKRFNQVKYNGNVYTARKDNKGELPNPTQDTEFWFITSMKGETGAKGERGYDGVNLVNKGEFNDNETYNKDNLVVYNGRSYFCKVDGTKGILPINTQNWGIFADRGLSTVYKVFKSNVVLEQDSNIVPINIPEFNVQEDDLEANYMGSLLTEGKVYKKSADGLNIESIDGSIWKKGSEFDFKATKNVNTNVPDIDPALMKDGSINKNKLNPTIFEEINNNVDNKIAILNGKGDLKEKANKDDFDAYKNEVKTSLDDKVSNTKTGLTCLHVFIDEKLGDDKNDGVTDKTPVATMERAIEVCNKHINVLSVDMEISGDYTRKLPDIDINTPRLHIYGSATIHNSRLYLTCFNSVRVTGIRLNNSFIYFSANSYCECYGVKFTGKPNSNACIEFHNVPIGYAESCTLDTSAYCFIYSDMSTIYTSDNRGSILSTANDAKVFYSYNSTIFEKSVSNPNNIKAPILHGKYGFYYEVK